MALDGTTALIAAPGDTNPNGSDAGSAYVFEWADGEWRQDAKLVANDGSSNDLSGWSVALNGDTALIGARNNETAQNIHKAGAAYVFHRSGSEWRQQAKLTAPDARRDAKFGSAVDLNGTIALIGARTDDENGEKSGAAYVFRQTNSEWEYITKITGEEAGVRFGETVALSEDTALVGFRRGNEPPYVFEQLDGEWRYQTTLPGGPTGFHSVALHGTTALVATRHGEGNVSVFEKKGSEWRQQTNLTVSDSVSAIGWHGVAVKKDTALIGSTFESNSNGEEAGAAYVFNRTDGSWTQQRKLIAPDGDSNDRFGAGVALDGNAALVGANRDEDPNGTKAGSAYVFTL